MMSIGLIEELLNQTSVIYFFCQRDNQELNTVEAIIKGFIHQLIDQEEAAKPCLRRRWNVAEGRFTEDTDSWRNLWYLFMEMLERCLYHREKCSCSKWRCSCRRFYIVIDALDECVDNHMAALLNIIVQTGLDYPRKLKWLLTSRPFESGEQTLVADFDQLHISLELNSEHISQAVRSYIKYKVTKLDHKRKYGSVLCRSLEDTLSRMAQDTFLWVSLVCQRLETVSSTAALEVIQSTPPTLIDLYDKAYKEICYSESFVTETCLRLLWGMVHAFRPLRTYELINVGDFPDDPELIRSLVHRCSSFIQMRHDVLEFIHQSARDYLVGVHPPILDEFSDYIGHQEMGYRCLNSLHQKLQSNLLTYTHNRNPRESIDKEVEDDLALGYAAAFWFQHVYAARGQAIIMQGPPENVQVETFILEHLLDWVQFLSLLGQLSKAREALELLNELSIKTKSTGTDLGKFVTHAKHFLSLRYQDILRWPLQIYHLVTVFEPVWSEMRQRFLQRYPPWLIDLSKEKNTFQRYTSPATFSFKTIECRRSGQVETPALSHDAQTVALGSTDGIVKLWQGDTQECSMLLKPQRHNFELIAVSSNADFVAIAFGNGTIEVHDTLNKLKTMVTRIRPRREGEQNPKATNILPNATGLFASKSGEHFALVADDEIIEIYGEEMTGRKISLSRYSTRNTEVAASLDGRWTASSERNVLTLKNVTTHKVKRMHFYGDATNIFTFAASEDDRLFVVGEENNQIKILEDASSLYRLLPGEPIILDNEDEEIVGVRDVISIPKDFPLFTADTANSEHGAKAASLQDFSFANQWIYYGKQRILLLPEEFKIRCFTSNGCNIAVGCEDGRVLVFAFDREILALS